MTVMMLTLLTGILGNNYDRFMEFSQAHFLREQAWMITSRARDPIVHKYLSYRLKEDQDKYLWAAFRDVEEVDDVSYDVEEVKEMTETLASREVQQQMMQQMELMSQQMTQLQASNDMLIQWFGRLKDRKREKASHGPNSALRSAGDPEGTAVCDTVADFSFGPVSQQQPRNLS